MRRLLTVMLFIAALSIPSFAQQVNRPADCLLPFSFTAVGSSMTFDNRGSACVYWSFSYQSYGFPAVSIQFDGAPDVTGAPGSFTIWPTVSSGTLPATTTTYTNVTGTGYAPFLNVALNSKTGTGRIYGTLMGWRVTSSGATITANIGTSGLATSTNQTNGSQKTQVVDTLGNVQPAGDVAGRPIFVTCTTTNCPGGGPSLPANAVPIVYSYENQVQGVTASLMGGTSSTQVIAGVGSNYMYISSCSVGNSSGSVNTFVNLQDGSGGTTIWTLTAADNYGGESHSFGDHPLHVPTLGNGLYAANATTGAAVLVSCNGFVSTNKYF